MGIEPASVRPSTLSDIDSSANSQLITMKFYQKHHWGGAKTALGLRPGRIRTLVSMATDSSQCCHFLSAVFHPILFILAGNDDMHESSEEFEIRHDPTTDCGVSCPLASEKFKYTYNWENGVVTLSRLFLIGSSSYLQITVTYLKLG